MPYLPDGESPWQSASTTSCVQQAKREIKQLFWNLLVLMSLDTGMLGVTSRFNTTQSVFAALLFFWEGTTLQSRCKHFFTTLCMWGLLHVGSFRFVGSIRNKFVSHGRTDTEVLTSPLFFVWCHHLNFKLNHTTFQEGCSWVGVFWNRLSRLKMFYVWHGRQLSAPSWSRTMRPFPFKIQTAAPAGSLHGSTW